MLVCPVDHFNVRDRKRHVFILISVPFIIVASAGVYLLYARIVRPSPIALGSQIPRFCVVSADEIRDYCESSENDTHQRPEGRQSRWGRVRVARNYIAQMTWNAKLFLQVARFEQLKINPAKSSLDYDPRETLILRLAEDATEVRLLLIKAQIALITQAFSGQEIKDYASRRLQKLVGEYKQLEFNAIALVGMAKDECYYVMLRERLGLGSWKLDDDLAAP